MKHIRKILAVLLIAMLFVSCNADMKDMGIFNTIKHSKPNTSFKLRKLVGALEDGRFLIETEEGIEVYNVNNESRTTLVKGLNASMKFIKDGRIYYTTQATDSISSSTMVATINGNYESTSDAAAITMKLSDGTEIKALENSFFENGKNILKAMTSYEVKDAEGNSKLQKDYYFITDPTDGKLADGVYTFNNAIKVEDNKMAPVYLGNGYYYVDQNLNKDNFKKIYDFDGNQIVLPENAPFTKVPFAVENNYLFASDGIIYKISGNTLTQVTGDNSKHSIIYVNPNQDFPMITGSDGIVYGVSNAKAFTFDGTSFTEYEYIADIHIIGLYNDGSRFYAFSDNNGVYTSTDGKTYKYN